MLIGMDVGGTNTDVAFVDGEVESEKVPNTAGIDAALYRVRRHGRLAVSTSTPLNVIVTRRERKVATVLMPGPGLLHGRGVRGAVNHCGDVVEEIDRDEVELFLRSNPADAVAIAGKFSVRNPALEEAAAEIARKYYPDEKVATSHPLAVLDFPARVATTRLNARIKEEVVRLCAVLSARKGDFLFFRGDGGLATPQSAVSDPSMLSHSSPAAAALGVHYLTGLSSCLVIDVGGTTTELIPLEGGIPRTQYLFDESERTVTRAVSADSIPYGGDSLVTEELEPRREGCALAFGGRAPTLTDALNVAGAEVGNHEASRVIPRRKAEEVIEWYCREVARRAAAHDFPVVAGCGFLAPYLVPEIARILKKPCVVPPHAGCANAVGVAVSRVSLTLHAHFDGLRKRVVMNGEVKSTGRVGDDDELVALCTDEVRRRALAAGAHPRDVDDVRLLYCVSYDVVRGSYRTARIADVAVQIAPGITAEAR
ncbi:MAG: hydantoinase/oxoprolinase family protein [Methanolinea sp.]